MFQNDDIWHHDWLIILLFHFFGGKLKIIPEFDFLNAQLIQVRKNISKCFAVPNIINCVCYWIKSNKGSMSAYWLLELGIDSAWKTKNPNLQIVNVITKESKNIADWN